MDQMKIGRFIAERRKAKAMTQAQLAECLCVTDRAVSKWETGKAMPDSSIMLKLCDILGITVNDLLNGEVVSVESYNKKSEDALLGMIKEKERTDRWLLSVEVLVGTMCVSVFLGLTVIAAYAEIQEWLRYVLIVIGAVPLIFTMPFLLRIEQVAGYYECKHCKHRFIPSFKAVNLAMHMGRTRHLRCPVCGKKTWCRKVIGKDSH